MIKIDTIKLRNQHKKLNEIRNLLKEDKCKNITIIEKEIEKIANAIMIIEGNELIERLISTQNEFIEFMMKKEIREKQDFWIVIGITLTIGLFLLMALMG